MQDLIARVATASGLEPDIAEQAIGKILAFLQKEGPAEDVARVLAAIPGAADLAEAHAGGGGGGLMGMLGGGLMGLAGQLSGLGLGMGEMQSVGHEIFAIAREQAGEDAVGEIAAAIPGLSQFI
ncbi:MAG: hypothetical protein RIQ68_460 [Pseudomonadota bacterium]|jgi:hypothetical protein